MKKRKVLIGNAYPLSLVDRHTTITPISWEAAQVIAKNSDVVSFWGHDNTAKLVSDALGTEIPFRRVALRTQGGLPCVDGESFNEVLILSPRYREGFRPQIGVEPTPADILSWQALLLRIE